MAGDTNEQLLALAKQLVGLLEANEGGLHTWHEAVHARLDEIAALSTYRPAVRDAHAILTKIPVPAAQEWVQKAERMGLVEERTAIHAEVRMGLVEERTTIHVEVRKTRPSAEPFILAPHTRVRTFE